MNKIYLDNAATSFPKPPCVPEAMTEYIKNIGCNINRGSYEGAYDAEETVYDTRELLAQLFHAGDERNVVFTKNITESLNVVLKGLLQTGDHVIVSPFEHNAVMRPLEQLKKQGVITYTVANGLHNANPGTPVADITAVETALASVLTSSTRAVVMTHASNVSGEILPIREAGEFCKKHGLIFIVDSAQTAGSVPIDMQDMNIGILAFTGHKGLLGPQGIGGFILSPELVLQIEPLISGGTGSISHTIEVPDFMPDRFEAGTMNIPGIYGLNAALKWLEATGPETIRAHEMRLTGRFLQQIAPLAETGKLRIIGSAGIENRVSTVSIQLAETDQAQAACRLEEEAGILTRVGLHCAPIAHQTLGTYPEGTIRFSFGYFNTEEEVDAAAAALGRIADGF